MNRALSTEPPVTPQRSRLMSRVRQRHTHPEMLVRRLLHSRGWRYRTHLKPLPGTPDIVFTKRRKAIFVHGCFWHGHQGCRLAKTPQTRSEFWAHKIDANRTRDKRKEQELLSAGWKVITVWQCQLSNPDILLAELELFLRQDT